VWHRINNQVVLRVPPGGPDGPCATYLRSSRNSLIRQGYCHHYVQRQVMLAAGFSRWLKEKGVPRHRVASEHPIRYLRYRHRQRRPNQGDSAALGHLMAFLRSAKAIRPGTTSTPQITPVEKCVQAYEEYLREERALAKATIVFYVPFVRSFLESCFGSGPVKLSSICAKDVHPICSRPGTKPPPEASEGHEHRAALILQYARYRGEIRLELSSVVPSVANWSMPSIPRGIAPDQVRRLLSQIDRSTVVGRRDYAILLLTGPFGFAIRRGCLSRARGHRLEGRMPERAQQGWWPDAAASSKGSGRCNRCLSAAWKTPQHESPSVLAGEGPHPRLSLTVCHRDDCSSRNPTYRG